jgi:hypothetical protein
MIRFSYDLIFKRAFSETLDSWLSTPDTTRSIAIYSRDTPIMMLNKTAGSFQESHVVENRQTYESKNVLNAFRDRGEKLNPTQYETLVVFFVDTRKPLNENAQL